MNKIKSACFAAVTVVDGHHDTYNWWHSSDHIPENVALQDVVFGVRWAAPKPLLAARLVVTPELAPSQYLVGYGMTDPLERAFRDVAELGQHTYDVGRSFAHRTVLYCGHHRLAHAQADAGVISSAASLPFRPHRGVFVVMADAPAGPLDTEVATWCQKVHIPAMLGVDGIIGAYWFEGTARLGPGGVIRQASECTETRHVFVYYLDGDPTEVASAVATEVPGWSAHGPLPGHPTAMSVILAGPYESILDPEHYRWDKR